MPCTRDRTITGSGFADNRKVPGGKTRPNPTFGSRDSAAKETPRLGKTYFFVHLGGLCGGRAFTTEDTKEREFGHAESAGRRRSISPRRPVSATRFRNTSRPPRNSMKALRIQLVWIRWRPVPIKVNASRPSSKATCHSRECGNRGQPHTRRQVWIPAFAGIGFTVTHAVRVLLVEGGSTRIIVDESGS